MVALIRYDGPRCKKRVLIVEDEVRMMQMLKEELENVGYSVLEATSGEQGLKVAESSPPELMLLDIMLPGMNAWTF